METAAWIIATLYLYGVTVIVIVIGLIIVGAEWRKLRVNGNFISFLLTSGAISIIVALIATSILGLFIYIDRLI